MLLARPSTSDSAPCTTPWWRPVECSDSNSLGFGPITLRLDKCQGKWGKGRSARCPRRNKGLCSDLWRLVRNAPYACVHQARCLCQGRFTVLACPLQKSTAGQMQMSSTPVTYLDRLKHKTHVSSFNLPLQIGGSRQFMPL